MANSENYIIDKVSWHTNIKRNYSFDDKIVIEVFKSIIRYLQDNNLTTKTILHDIDKVNEDTCFSSSDLTAEGLELIRSTYDKWMDRVVDKKIKPDDYALLNKKLKNLRKISN